MMDIGALGVGRLLGALGGLGWCPPPTPASVKVNSGKNSNVGVCAHMAPSQQPQGAMVVRLSALGGTWAVPSQGGRKALPPAGFRVC